MVKKEPKESPFLQDVGTDQGISPRDNESWMKSRHRDKFIKMLTGCFGKVLGDWHPNDSCRVISAIERLLFRSIDTELLMKDRIYTEGITFNFNVMENVGSDDLFELLLDYHPNKWDYIQDEFSRKGTVDFVYEDRYLNSPLGCLMLAQFIRRMQFQFHLNFRSIRIYVSKKDFHVKYDDNTLKPISKFSYPESRDKFLCQCMDKIVGQPFELIDKNISHTRSMRVSNGEYELNIHPEGGISHGWELMDRSSTLTAEDILRDPDINIQCFNRLAHSSNRKGIPYMVEFIPVQKVENHQEKPAL